jgi:hypothetical protein
MSTQIESYLFTEEGLRLATFYLALQNNALLKLQRYQLERIENRLQNLEIKNGIEEKYSSPEITQMVHEGYDPLFKTMQAEAMKEAYEFAVENDNSLNLS